MLMNVTRRASEPVPELYSSLHRLNRMMDEAMTGWGNGGTLASAWTPSCDVFEDKENLKIVLELPGVKPEDVKLSLENQVLTVRGEKKQVAEENSDRWHRYERSYGSFERTFTLPSTVDGERIQATVDHGVLTITLPKSEKSKPREIPVRAGQSK
jgi:HSP20 family protein